MILSRAWHRLAPALVLTTGACFATRNDVRILQGDILTLRTEAARADSARRRQGEQLAAQLATNVTAINDSLRGFAARLGQTQGENRGEFRRIQESLIQLQELMGASSQLIMKFRADLEARALQQAAAVPPPVPADTTGGAGVRPVTPPTVAVGPDQLYQAGLDQARRSNYSAAQAAFEELLATHPTSDRVPDALAHLADAYDADGKYAQADSTTRRLVGEHPRSPRAPTALYKMGLSLAKRGRRADARALMERVAREYPVSDAADFARDWLMRNR